MKRTIEERFIPDDYVVDCQKVRAFLEEHGIGVSLLEAYSLWSSYSDLVCAGWLIVDRESLNEFLHYAIYNVEEEEEE